MKLTFTPQEIQHLKFILRADLADRAKRLKLCSTTATDDAIASHVESYNKTNNLLTKITHPTTDDLFADDGMFTDERS